MKKVIKDKTGFSGKYLIKTYRALPGFIPNWLKYKIHKYFNKPLWVSPVISNLVVSSSGYGRNLVMRRLGGDTTYGFEIDSGKIGTGTTAPTNSDTDLETAVLSNIAVVETEIVDNQLTLSFFIPSGDLANNTYNEFGIFIGGRLFARSIIDPAFVKGSNQDTTLEYVLTLN